MTKDLVKLGHGIFLWPHFPPYVVMIGFKDRTEHRQFETEEEFNNFIKIINDDE